MVKENSVKQISVVRPPIVVVLGHVDHGKTTLLDTIRKTNVAGKESGGITQHIGAYQVQHNGKMLTFIDTPGHEAFGQMRSRGAQVADIAIVVVAAEEGVKPQTKEALDIVKSVGIPYMVAINKVDKPNAQPEKVKRELAENGVILEGWGGDVPNLLISAKGGTGIPELLDLLLLIAEINELKNNPNAPASGVVIEAHKDAKRGAVATLLVRDGTLKISVDIVIGSQYCRIRSLGNFKGESITEAGPSTPVLVSGFSEVPDVGDTFISVSSDKEAEEIIAKEKESRRFAVKIGGENPEVIKKIIIKSDVVGSLEAIIETLKKISSKIVSLDIIFAETGEVTENDIKRASVSGASIIAFRAKVSSSLQLMAQKSNVTIVSSDIIYELVDGIRIEMEAAVPPEVIRTDLGVVKILATFKQEGARQVIGGEVIKGTVRPGILIDVERGGHHMGRGKLASVQMNKVSVDEAVQGKQCGLQIDLKGMSVLPGDVVKCFIEDRHKRPLL